MRDLGLTRRDLDRRLGRPLARCSSAATAVADAPARPAGFGAWPGGLQEALRVAVAKTSAAERRVPDFWKRMAAAVGHDRFAAACSHQVRRLRTTREGPAPPWGSMATGTADRPSVWSGFRSRSGPVAPLCQSGAEANAVGRRRGPRLVGCGGTPAPVAPHAVHAGAQCAGWAAGSEGALAETLLPPGMGARLPAAVLPRPRRAELGRCGAPAARPERGGVPVRGARWTLRAVARLLTHALSPSRDGLLQASLRAIGSRGRQGWEAATRVCRAVEVGPFAHHVVGFQCSSLVR